MKSNVSFFVSLLESGILKQMGSEKIMEYSDETEREPSED